MTNLALDGYDDRLDRARKYFMESFVVPREHPALRPMMFGGAVTLAAAAVVGLIGSMEGTFAMIVVVFGFAGAVTAGVGYLKYLEFRRLEINASNSKRATEPKATDQEMDAWLEEDLKACAVYGLARFGPSAAATQQQYAVFVGPADSTSRRAKRGADLEPRFSEYQVLIVYLQDSVLSAYEFHLDTVTGKASHAQTKEYPVTAVDGVEVFSGSRRFDFVNETPIIGSMLYRPRTHARIADTQIVRIAVSGRVVIGIEVTLGSDRKSAGAISLAQVDSRVAELRKHVHLPQDLAPSGGIAK